MENSSSFETHIFWDRFLQAIEERVNVQSFNTWFKPLVLIELSFDNLIISVPQSYHSSWLEEHYMPLLKASAVKLLERDINISFSINEEEKAPVIETVPVPHMQEITNAPHIINESSQFYFEQHIINPRFSFDSFVVGNSNQFAHAAAKAVAESPGTTAFNPLVLYGGVGLGKTHILQAIANHCKNNSKQSGDPYKLIFVTSEKFTMDFIMSIQNNQTAQLSNYYRNADLLLVDDIQFFNNKERTQEEFFHIFNTLHQSGKQIVLTMDRPPSQLKGLADRLINRFQWGLVTDIQPPDFETRMAILKKKAEADGVDISDSIFSYIAENIKSNIRELEGALIRLLAYSSLRGEDISLEMAGRVLGETFTIKPSIITIEFIQKVVGEYFSLPPDAVMSNSRRKEVAVARHIAMHLCKRLTDSSLKTIGLHFGGRDHSTVIHSLRTVENKYLNDPVLSKHIEALTEKAKTS